MCVCVCVCVLNVSKAYPKLTLPCPEKSKINISGTQEGNIDCTTNPPGVN